MRPRLSCLLLLPVIAACGKETPAPVAAKAALPAIVEPAVRTVKDGDAVRFLFDSPEAYAVTVTVRAQLQGMEADRRLPLTRSSQGAREQALFTLRPVPGGAGGKYRYEWRWQCGDAGGVHDGAQAYLLPLAPGADYELIQGAGGSFSHQGASFNAYDFSAPEGTAVRAARAGVVCATRADSDRGGPTRDYADDANYVAVVHADGTVGWYLHLRQHGVVVEPGEAVAAGQVLGYSGNTGYSSRPHLHFEVYKPLSGYARRSLPVRFDTGAGEPQALEQGRYYQPAAGR
ncbi:M23 family peptidase [Solimonas fluminis]|uniref:M23 family peptidase n=1 Tax=Solimonas fluminis TaxID=2086571 RepID=A0A2S5TJ87_9GAMM|nr:M23 family metallopeptidase [Solimonas fluminis]PPE75049.1 M23 family peptidase [Solimonas fluminis]